ncbi:hypothetical protein Q9Q94_10215 [Uliginosibacterium sp. 31-16]|uniref:hypothetical protein n=1 Tax=Uliginosibacterium sp. 31-16 TaxID=3068315 RepID=UPI00273DF91F|nr:hypothetical protein [Uliginosibacterium sp. 31-16]MDP5239909.1 hypothetical protein [Uliginosibacterium sp. 31-16]
MTYDLDCRDSFAAFLGDAAGNADPIPASILFDLIAAVEAGSISDAQACCDELLRHAEIADYGSES